MKTTQKATDEQASFNERRAGTRNAIAKMIAERNEVLALYWRLAGLESFENGKREPARKLLQEFCQLLVDYIAAGHFSLYERIVNGTERRRDIAQLAQDLYPRIAATTTTALDFNDKYDSGDKFEVTDGFKADLSRVGEELALRIDLEDKLIALMLR